MLNIRKFLTGIRIIAKSVLASDTKGELEVNDSDGKLNYHNGSSRSPVLTEAHSATVTNKSIDADNNTITNIDNADIKSGAAIDASKIADGSVSNAEFQYLNGVTSDIQTQLNNITGSAVTSLTGDVTGTGPGATATTIANGAVTNVKVASGIDAVKIADGSVSNTEFQYLNGVTSDIQTQLNGKEPTITTLPINKGGTGQTTQTDAFDALAPSTTKGDLIVHDGTDNIRLAIGADGQVPVADSTQASGIKWGAVQGIKNYIANPGAESNTSGWATYADAADVRPVNGTGGSPSVTFTRSTTTPLSGVGSFIFTKDAVNRQGQGVSYDFTIDRQDQAKVLQISFSYLVNSGTFNTNNPPAFSDLAVFIYDVTNSKLIEPSSTNLLSNSSTIADQFNATFQSSPDSTSYRLILHCSTTSGSAYSLKLDSFVVNPSTYVYGTPVTDWKEYVPSIIGHVSNPTKGTTVTDRAFWRRVGDSVQIRYEYDQSSAGAAGSGFYKYSLPPGINIDVTKLIASTASASTALGSATVYAGVNVDYGVVQASDVAGYFSIASGPSANRTSSTFYALSNTIVQTSAEFMAPVVGWSSSVQTSDQTDTRIVSSLVYCDTNQSIPDNTETTVDWNVISQDTHGSFNLSTNEYTIPVNGTYNITGVLQFAGTAATYEAYTVLFVNNVATEYQHSPKTGSLNTIGALNFNFKIANAKTGDVILLKVKQSSGGALNLTNGIANGQKLSIERISGPSAIAANETIACKYYDQASTTITTTDAVRPFATKVYDTHNAFNGTVFTAPVSGFYSFSVNQISVTTLAASDQWEIRAYKNGTSPVAAMVKAGTGASNTNNTVAIVGDIDLLAGDTLQFNSFTIVGNLTLNSAAGQNQMSIHRIGK